MNEVMSEERLKELDEMAHGNQSRGFRFELIQAITEIHRLRQANEALRGGSDRSAIFIMEPDFVAFRCERVAKDFDSELHRIAALCLRELLKQIPLMQDDVQDLKDCGRAALLLKSVVTLIDTRCRLDNDGACLVHGGAKPCRVAMARELFK